MTKTNENVEKKPREHHVKSLRLLRLEKAIQTIAYPDVARLMKKLYREEIEKMRKNI